MSGLQYLLSKTLSVEEAAEPPKKPESFTECLDDLLDYCNKQLPTLYNLDFKPVSFDISKDEETLVIGGEHGNVAVYDMLKKVKIRDEEKCGIYSVVSILFVLNEQQIVFCSSKSDIHFLEYPTLKNLYKIELNYSPIRLNDGQGTILNVSMKLGSNEEWLYYCNYTEEVQIMKLSTTKDYYRKRIDQHHIETQDKVTCLDISDDGTLIAVGLDNNTIGLIHADTFTKLQSTENYTSRPLLVTFSQNRKYIAAGFEDFKVIVWRLDNVLTKIYEMTDHKDIVTGITFINNNENMVTASGDNNIIVWNMRVESLPYTMNLLEKPVMHFKVAKDYSKVYFSQDYNAIMSWSVPNLHKNARYTHHKEKVNKVIFMPNGFELLSIGDDGLAILWDFRNNLMQDSIQLDGQLITASIPPQGEYACICSSNKLIYRWTFSTGLVEETPLGSPGISMSFSADGFSMAVSDELSRILIYDADVMEKKDQLKGHKDIVSSLAFILDNEFLLSASLDSEIGKWNLAKGEKVATFKGHKTGIDCMIATSNDWVISASEDEIIVWNIDGILMYYMPIREMGQGKVKGFYLSLDFSYLLCLQENVLNYWQIDNLSIMFQTSTKFAGGSISVASDEKTIAVSEGHTIFLEDNPMLSINTRIVGLSQGSQQQYMKFIIDSQKKDSIAEYTEAHNHWVIVPYLISVAHILAYSNRIDDLSHSLFDAKNKVKFFSTINYENPLSLAVDLEYKNIIDVCFKHMKSELGKRNIRAFASIEKCLTQLNGIEYPDISKIYDLIFKKVEGNQLPEFCLHETELPILHTSENLVVIAEDIISKEYFSSTGRPVVFQHSLCLLDIELGTQGSLEFLESLLNGDEAVYNSRIVKEFLTCKWEKIQTLVNTQGFIYIVYMILLSVYTVSFMQNNDFLGFVLAAHLILFSLEILQFVTDYKNYFFDVWNIFDQLRTWSFFVYIISVYWYDEYSYNKLLAVIIFSWLRGISYFRMFEGTRYMVRLLGRVILDMRVFFTILAYSTIGFAFIFYLRNPSTSFLLYLTTSYRLDLGDFSTDYTAVFDWVVFFLATMMNPMIMLNLLISILSDTAARVSQDSYVANLQELTRMIIEVERVMFWKKNVTAKHYLHYINFVEDEKQQDKVIERCKFIKSKLDKMQRNLELINDKMTNVNVGQIEESIKSMKEAQVIFKQEMNGYFEKNNGVLSKISDKLSKRG
ncbi:hypothetical protein SteCoe_22300 [Stentor coeruleus]|uniref:Uncharacterized protein n=1 Tax=Stentor coeruleus TaxID=5963 RepID=A0A1R2BMC7_9CILI|nr:hypothetical protein SteCoe_22300 [Stentor coeruleus]